MSSRHLLVLRLASLLVACALVPSLEANTARRHMLGTPGVVTHVRERLVLDRFAIHELAGPVQVEAGGALVIEAGARIEARPGSGIDVQRDGAIIAEGTLLEPIVFTCTSTPRYAGCWKGLRVHGFGRINFGTADSPADPQGGSGGCLQSLDGADAFGGCADADSSGVLRFVRVEYAADGVRLRGVGSGTHLDHVQVNRALGDGLSIEGGAVDFHHLFLTANGGYGLSWRAGWRGRAQFVVVQQDATTLAGGISGSNAGVSGGGFTNLPRSVPILFNVTVIAPALSTLIGERPALHLRQGTGGAIRNLLVHSSALVLDLDENSTCSLFGDADGVSIGNVVLAANTQLGSPDTDPSVCEPYSSPTLEAQWLNDATTAAFVVTDPAALATLLRNPTNLAIPDLRPAASGATSTNPLATPPNDGFFEVAASYAGAVAPATAARNNVPWYAGWTVPAPTPSAPGIVSGVVASASLGVFPNIVVSTAFGLRDTTDASGAFSLVLPAGQHVLSLSGLPIGCSAAPLTVTAPSGSAFTANITADCTIVADIAVGALHACLMTGDNRLQCWGQNTYGMVGDGTTVTPRLFPVIAAANVPYDPLTLSAGLTHTCATRVSTTFCWGLNVFGVLGLGTTGAFTASPVSVGSFSTPVFSRVAAGGYHACGLTPAGEAWCWGWNAEGQVGANSATFSIATPTAVAAGATRFATLALGESHSCGLTTAGAAWCWGGNGRGESGRDTAGADLKSLAPVLVSTSLAFTSIDAGTLHTCALTVDGTAYCWGSREFGQLGDGNSTGIGSAPVPVSTSEKFTQLAAGGFTTCGVTTTRRVLCWGAGAAGALGNGSTTAVQTTPVATSPVLDARRVAASLADAAATTVCAIATNDAVFCWGAGSAGQLGNGTTTSSTVPLQVRVRGPF
ncbi:hypothetical protein [Gemmatimonas sp.]|uniref:RCC1 domain-containing protein n=1 Tax=Gemmatimonas sp. TaxID=1962908 RepID=UPI00286C8023|nr:hypothetical protein [Gemmatimonas sp.]